MTIQVVNGSECYAPFSCLDTSGVAFTPSSLSYQVWDRTNRIEVVPPTTVTAAQTGTITLDSTVNTMSPSSVTFEERRLTLKIGIPGGSYEILETTYTLVRYEGTP